MTVDITAIKSEVKACFFDHAESLADRLGQLPHEEASI
ncbi:hypothetical protein SynBIOSE41_00815 [Synechococcus sp. BIOS-E4-1]|nr:hypothetical protein SynBIOSE41_00815 [Synechococcus sp. BIOS-E4-1]